MLITRMWKEMEVIRITYAFWGKRVTVVTTAPSRHPQLLVSELSVEDVFPDFTKSKYLSNSRCTMLKDQKVEGC